MRYPRFKAKLPFAEAQSGPPKPSLLRTRYGPYTLQSMGRLEDPDSTGRQEHVVKNPATGEDIGTVIMANAEDAQTTIYDAHQNFRSGVWSKKPAVERAQVLSALAHVLSIRMEEFVYLESMQTGRPIREMKAQLGRLPEWLEYFAAALRTHQGFIAPTQGKLLNYVQRIPLGVVAQVTPFNHPLLIAIKKIAPALAAGNSVIVKPSEAAPLSVLQFAEMSLIAGVPPGVLNVLPGYGKAIVPELASHPLVRKVDITAGTKTGRAIGKLVGSNLAEYTAELGGKAPIVVFKDADIQSAVSGAAFACFIASGQTCVSGTRLIIQDEIYDEFMEQFLKKVESITARMGNPLNEKTMMGTVISQGQLERIEKLVQRPGIGNILTGGRRLTGTSPLDGHDFSKGSFFPPTVISDVQLEDDLWREEVFGPVVVVKRFYDEAEGIELANACKYGLGAGIWTSDLSRAHRVAAEIESGLVWVNTHHRNDPSSPWGGMKQSGIGRENGLEALDAYTQSKSTIVNIASAEETRTTIDWFADDDVSEKRYG